MVAKVEHRILLAFVIAIGQIHDDVLLEPLALFIVGKGFVSIVIKVLQSALLFRLGQITVGNRGERSRKMICGIICVSRHTAFNLQTAAFCSRYLAACRGVGGL